jgi:hypothetical protein
MERDAMARGIGPDRLLFPKLMDDKKGVVLNKNGGIWPVKSFPSRSIFLRLCICSNIPSGIWPESLFKARSRSSSLVRFPKAEGMAFDRLFPIRPRDLR